MVTGMSKAYRCNICGALFLRSRNGRLVIVSDEEENIQKPEPSQAFGLLKKLFGFSNCPRCGSWDVFEDSRIRT